MSNPEFDPLALSDLLPIYYKRLFPYSHFYRWLSYGNPLTFAKREICFTLIGNIYLRYQSFDTQDEFTKQLQKKYPLKIDLGAVYQTKPRERGPVSQIIPVEKEIVFDIDMSDYDEVRTCCSKAKVCPKCWKFMAIACRILDSALTADFAYKHKLWVFSGRRGIHCWVCDKKARKQEEEVRSSVADYLEVVKGGTFSGKKVSLPGDIHKSLERALKIIDKYFLDIVEEQDILGTEPRFNTFLQMIDNDLRPTFKTAMKRAETSLERWNIFEETLDDLQRKGSLPRHLKNLKDEIKLHYTYPRLDINVTKGLNHLLKSPFSVHPSSGKVSVPFDPKNVDSFDPDKVPLIHNLIDEIDLKTKDQENGTNSNVKDETTSLSEAISIFETFLKGVELENPSKVQEVSMDF